MSDSIDSHKIYVDLSKTRDQKQLAEYEVIEQNQICPFCVEHRDRYTQGKRLYDGEFWWIFENNWPYENTAKHIMLVYKKHAVYLEDIDSRAGGELHLQLKEIEKDNNNISLAALVGRFGFVYWTGASVNHLHFHLLFPMINSSSVDDFTPEYRVGELLHSDNSWDIYKDAHSEENSKYSFLIISQSPAVNFSDLTTASVISLISSMQWLEDEFNLTHGGFSMRVGKTNQQGIFSNKIVMQFVVPTQVVTESSEHKLKLRISGHPKVDFKVST